MDSEAFVAELVSMVDDFCRTLDASPPAYSYIPLSTDDERVLVMKSRLFNEQRAADLYGSWLADDTGVRRKGAHGRVRPRGDGARRRFCRSAFRGLGHDPFDYRPLPAQTAMFNALEGLSDTCQRIAGFALAGESVATYLILKSLGLRHRAGLDQGAVSPHSRGRGGARQRRRGRCCSPSPTTPERQDAARRAVAMRLVLFREYLASLDRWVLGKAPW